MSQQNGSTNDIAKALGALAALVVAGWVGFSACASPDAPPITTTVTSWEPLDSSNVVATISQHNTGNVPGSSLCSYVAEAPGGDAGTYTDEPVAAIAPGATQSFTIRIHTEVNTSEITGVTVDNSICARSAENG